MHWYNVILGAHTNTVQVQKRCSSLSSTLGAVMALFPCVAIAEMPVYPVGQSYEIVPYGKFAPAWQSFDDGAETTSNIVDMSTDTSRLGFYLQPRVGADGLSFQFETSYGFRASENTSQRYTPPAWNWSRQDLRQVQLIYSGKFGKLRFGQGSMPSEGVAESDLASTAVVAKATIQESYGSYLLRTSENTLTSITIGSIFDDFDGPRKFRLRYDTPDISGFSIAVAYGAEVLTSDVDDRYYGLVVRYDRSFRRFKLKGAFGNSYVNSADGVSYSTVGSFSVLDTTTGLNFSLASGQTSAGPEPSYIYAKAGWNANLIEVGVTKFVLEGYWGEDYVTEGSASRMWGVAIMQDFNRPNLQLYAGLRVFSYEDNTPAKYQDANAIQFGALFEF